MTYKDAIQLVILVGACVFGAMLALAAQAAGHRLAEHLNEVLPK